MGIVSFKIEFRKFCELSPIWLENGTVSTCSINLINRARVSPLYTSDSKICALANSEDQDEMPHNAAFHQGLHHFLRQKRSSEKEIQIL